MPIDLGRIAEEFPGAKDQIYLNCAARGLTPKCARSAVDALLDAGTFGSGDKDEMFETVERVRDGFAQMINAQTDEIAITKNVSEGLNAIIAALDLKAGDNVVLCPDLEHPNNVYPWLHLRERLGVEIRTVTGNNGHMPIEDMIAAMDEKTRCVTVASVSFSPGFRTDIAPLGAACRDRGTFFLVDGVQSVGIIETNIEALQIDGLAVSTQKGLLGLYGMGLLYCRREWADRITPVYLARFGVDLGSGVHEAALGSDNYRLMPGARRFDLGNHNYVGAYAVAESIDLLNDISTKNIEAHVGALTRQLADGLLALDLPVVGGPAGAHLASLLCVGRLGGGGHDSTDDEEMSSFSQHLSANKVQHSIRQGLIRLSLHLYNTEKDVADVIALARTWRDTRAAA
ncbi:MAG: aminotransferase class V-fold PLP-dependent enzyme [Alphaproteobacteria bacterium]|nr:aminotransferase class V-fold PLP-dependent enzyme [Alphaproteobacteria bacterium]